MSLIKLDFIIAIILFIGAIAMEQLQYDNFAQQVGEKSAQAFDEIFADLKTGDAENEHADETE